MVRGVGGRQTLLQAKGITVSHLIADYLELGTYEAVATRYGVTARTIRNYLGGLGLAKKGRPQGAYSSEARRWVEDHIELLRGPDRELLAAAADDGLRTTYLRKVLQDKRSRVTKMVEDTVRGLLRTNKAILDTKGRYIPTAAIRYVWVPRWHWDRPVYVRAVLRDGTHAKLPTLYHPTIDDAREV